MKVANFITHTLLFLAAWLGLSIGSWGAAHQLALSTLMPWILPTLPNLSSSTLITPAGLAYTAGAMISIGGALLLAMFLLVVLIALEGIVHYLRRFFAGGQARPPSNTR